VRQLAFNLNGQLCSKCGKRIAKHIPNIAGPWLSGIYDSDRSAAKAANDSLHAVFSSPEKLQNLRKTFQSSILKYCEDAILRETPQSLSDERIVSSDDAEATYARVVSACIAVVSNLIESLAADELSKHSEDYENILTDPKFWEFAQHSDPGVRRALHRFVRICGEKRPQLVEDNLQNVSTAYIYKGLPSDQTSSSSEYVMTLEFLTERFISVWTHAYTAKRSVASRLRSCLKHGSYSGVASFWTLLSNVIRALPSEILPTSTDGIAELLEAAREGAARKEERLNSQAAWTTYVDLLNVLVSQADTTAVQEDILTKYALPLVEQFIQPTDDAQKWNIAGAKSAGLIARACTIPQFRSTLQQQWPLLCDRVIELARLSQPEQSSNYEKSQKLVASTGQRLADLEKEILKSELVTEGPMRSTITTSSMKLVEQSIDLLKSRNGKPFGAAAIVREQLQAGEKPFLQDPVYQKLISDFATDDVPRLIQSPSQSDLAKILLKLEAEPFFEAAFTNSLESVLGSDSDSEKLSVLGAINALLPLNAPRSAIQTARGTDLLQTFLATKIPSMQDERSATTLSNLFKIGAVRETTSEEILSHMTASLHIASESLPASMAALEHLAKNNHDTMRTFITHANGKGSQLLPNILLIKQSTDGDISVRADALSSRLSSAISDAGLDVKYSAVLQNLVNVSQQALPIHVILELADRIEGSGQEHTNIDAILPDVKIWQDFLLAVISPPAESLSVLSPFGGALHLLQDDIRTRDARVEFDGEGLSAALRIAIYVTKVLGRPGVELHGRDHLSNLVALLSITSLLAEDNVSIIGTNGLWDPRSNAFVENDVLEFISDANAVQQNFRVKNTPKAADTILPESPLLASLAAIKSDSPPLSPMAYYSSLATARITDNIFETIGYHSAQAKASEDVLRSVRAKKELLSELECLVGMAQPLAGSPIASRMCNELIAELTTADAHANQKRTLEALLTLNVILATQEDVASSIATTRLVLFVKHIIPWVSSEASASITTETYKTIGHLLPCMADMYGEHWTRIVKSSLDLWTSYPSGAEASSISEHDISLGNASLRLYAGLTRLVNNTEDANDDLIAAMDDQSAIAESLVNMLKAFAGASDANHSPLRVTNELLGRQFTSLKPTAMKNANGLYSAMYSPSVPLQSAAFELLRKHVVASQEQISLDAALDNKTARMSHELVSLLLQSPSPDIISDASFEREMPIELRSYLFSWRLVFDHFAKSSYRVRADYSDQIKQNALLPPLLSLTFDLLGHTNGKPIDATKFDIENYKCNDASSPERDAQWLLAHLFYLSMLYLPNLVQSYVRDVRSRQTSQAIETWTAKYISPSIINASLQEVAVWAEKSVKEDPEYESMTVKPSMQSKEVNVSYVVDEQIMAIKVVLPETYPLDSAKVLSVSRVAVKEEKWQSWLRNCQGVITFSVRCRVCRHYTDHFVLTCNPNRTAASSTVFRPGERTSPERSKVRPSAPSATPSSAATNNCPRNVARPARTSSIPAACSNGSRPAMRAAVHYVGIHSTSTNRPICTSPVYSLSNFLQLSLWTILYMPACLQTNRK
jgi:hypothetical protein